MSGGPPGLSHQRLSVELVTPIALATAGNGSMPSRRDPICNALFLCATEQRPIMRQSQQKGERLYAMQINGLASVKGSKVRGNPKCTTRRSGGLFARCDATDALRDFAEPIDVEVRVSRSRGGIRVTEQTGDFREGRATRDGGGREAMAEIVQPHVVKSRGAADGAPRVFD